MARGMGRLRERDQASGEPATVKDSVTGTEAARAAAAPSVSASSKEGAPGCAHSTAPPRVDITLIKAVARAFRWRRMLDAGHYATVKDLAAAEKINSSYVSRVLRLTLLAPDIVEAILDGRQPEGLTLPALMEPFPVEWAEQGRTAVAGCRSWLFR